MMCFVLCFGFLSGDADRATAVSEFCEIWRRTVKNELKLTEAEVRHLRRVTKLDLASIKKYAKRHCK